MKIDFDMRFEELLVIKDRALELIESGDTDGSIELLKKAISYSNVLLKVAPNDHYRFLLSYFLGSFYRRVSLLGESEEFSRRAVSLKPQSEKAVLSLYLTLVDMEKYDEAIGELLKYSEQHVIVNLRTTIAELWSDYERGLLPQYEAQVQLLVSRAQASDTASTRRPE